MSKVKLTDICNITTGKLDSNAAEENGKYPYFTCAPEPLYINEYAFDEDAILLAGNNASGNFHCQRFKGKFNAYQRTYVITSKEGYNIDYIYYNLKINLQYFKKISQGSQTKFLTMKILESFEVEDLNIENQNKLVKILLYLDRKIENNNKINAELEVMAKTIYDYWFLQFEFPNEEGKPYKSSGGKMVWNEELKREIPEGWECKKLDEVFDFVKGKIPDKLFEKKDDELIEYLTIEAVNSGTIKYCSKESMVTTTGEVLMVMDGAASSDVYVGNIGVIGSTFCKLEIKNNYVDNNFLFLIMKKLEPIFKKVNTGSTVPHANKNYINNFKICLPKDDKLRFKLQQSIVSCINKIVKNKQQNQELTYLQDFLLPLLMNGQVGFREVALAE